MGRPPQPTALKLLKSRSPGRDSGGRPLNKSEPRPSPSAPSCPSWLTAEAKAEWRRVCPQMDELGLLSRIDRGALATYCEAWARLKEATQEIQRHGLVVVNVEAELDDGRVLVVRPTKNPAAQVAKDASMVIKAFCAEFGLSPSSRGRMTLPQREDADLASRLLS